MKTLILISLTLLSNLTFGQFAIISDKDGYSNIRSKAEAGNNINDTLNNGHFVFCLETKGNWTNIDYSKKNQDLNGYLFHDRLQLISAYENIPPLIKETNSSTYGKDSIKIIVTKQKFDKTKYRLTYVKGSQSQIQYINGKQYWGEDGGLPKTEYRSISIIIGSRKIDLPRTAVEDLFEPSLHHTQASYDRRKDILYIQSMNSDGAGSYYVIWRIEKGSYKDRYIAYGF